MPTHDATRGSFYLGSFKDRRLHGAREAGGGIQHLVEHVSGPGEIEVQAEVAHTALLVVGRVPLLERVLVADVSEDGLGLPHGEAVVILHK